MLMSLIYKKLKAKKMKIKFELKKINKQNLKLHIQILSADLKFIDRKQNKKIFFSNFGFFRYEYKLKVFYFIILLKYFTMVTKLYQIGRIEKRKKNKRILTAFYCFWFN